MLAALSFKAADAMAARVRERVVMIPMVDGHVVRLSLLSSWRMVTQRRLCRSEIDKKEARRTVLITARLFS